MLPNTTFYLPPKPPIPPPAPKPKRKTVANRLLRTIGKRAGNFRRMNAFRSHKSPKSVAKSFCSSTTIQDTAPTPVLTKVNSFQDSEKTPDEQQQETALALPENTSTTASTERPKVVARGVRRPRSNSPHNKNAAATNTEIQMKGEVVRDDETRCIEQQNNSMGSIVIAAVKRSVGKYVGNVKYKTELILDSALCWVAILAGFLVCTIRDQYFKPGWSAA